MAMVLELTPITGVQVNRKMTLSGRVVTIGSAPGNDVVLNERQITPRHLEIHQMLDRFFVVPLTANGQGVALNGVPVDARSRLKPGDILTLGANSYRVAISEQLEQAVGAPRGAQQVPRLGDYLVRRGLMNGDQVAHTVRRQSELQRTGQHIAFGQLAYDLGYVNRSQLENVLNEQRNDFNERFKD